MLGACLLANAGGAVAAPAPQFAVKIPGAVGGEPVTGRLYVYVGKTPVPEPHKQNAWWNSAAAFGMAIDAMKPGDTAIVGPKIVGFPFHALSDLPKGHYYVQATLEKFVRYPRADGHTIWARDPWGWKSGLLYSTPIQLDWDPAKGQIVTLALTKTVEKPAAQDTSWLKHVRIKSTLLSKFWGRDMFLEASVLLPKDYDKDASRRYPVIYSSNLDDPFEFSTSKPSQEPEEKRHHEYNGGEDGYQFYQSWNGANFPRVIAVTLVHPTPFYNWPPALNSRNIGPYDDAVMQELIPEVEKRFRIIAAPYARVISGRPTGAGGRGALAMVLHHPDFFGGAWVFYPWGFDYRHYFGLNIYQSKNAYTLKPSLVPEWMRRHNDWYSAEVNFIRTLDGHPLVSMRAQSLSNEVYGKPGLDGEFGFDFALNGPVGADGYPKPLWDAQTGAIDAAVREDWRKQDLAEYAHRNWAKLSEPLKGKLHFFVGETDEYHRAEGVHAFEDFVRGASGPSYPITFRYDPQRGNGFQPMTNAQLVRDMAASIRRNAPAGADTRWAMN